jgi:hypothetical protein
VRCHTFCRESEKPEKNIKLYRNRYETHMKLIKSVDRSNLTESELLTIIFWDFVAGFRQSCTQNFKNVRLHEQDSFLVPKELLVYIFSRRKKSNNLKPKYLDSCQNWDESCLIFQRIRKTRKKHQPLNNRGLQKKSKKKIFFSWI